MRGHSVPGSPHPTFADAKATFSRSRGRRDRCLEHVMSLASIATIVAPPPERRSVRARVGKAVPILVLAPSLAATFIYVFVFTGWTLYISLSNSTLLPSYGFVGLAHYRALWSNHRWNIASTN